MPLSSVNYSGGIIITDWYTDEENIDESVKISIRFLTNELELTLLILKYFTKNVIKLLVVKYHKKLDH